MNDILKRFYQVVEELHQECQTMMEVKKYQASEIARLYAWIGDLQSEMYVNCVYCGHRYGPKDKTPVTMAEMLKEHIEICPQHPMSALKQELKILQQTIQELEGLEIDYWYLRACKMCGEYKPKLDEHTGRFGCFYCAPVRVPKFS